MEAQYTTDQISVKIQIEMFLVSMVTVNYLIK